jgi:hypothetical protein
MKRTLLVAVILFAFLSTFSFIGTTSKAEPDCTTLTFITESLPDFQLDEPVSFQIEASGGTPPYKFKITDGVLPAGLELNKDGVIFGVPTQEADTVIFVRLKDTGPCQTTRAYAVRVTSSE